MTRRKPIDDVPQQQTAVPAPNPSAWFEHRPWLLALVLLIVAFAAYQPTWHAGFIWDDDDHLTANPAMTSPHGLKMIWSSLAVSRYYPLTLTTFWFQHQLWDLDPLPYHLINIALHALSGFLIFLVLRRLRVPAAWLAAMLWVLHPVNVESVAWITELKNTQSGFFFFLSILCFLRFEADKTPRWYAFALVCGLAAMLSKSSTVVLPLVLLLCVWWERGRWRFTDIVRTAPFFGLAIIMSVLTIVQQRGHVLGADPIRWQSVGPAGRLVVAGKAVCFYADKVLWPVRLTFVYPRWTVDASSWWSWAPIVVLGLVAVILWRSRRRAWSRPAMFAGGFFLVALFPVLGFFDVFYFRYSFVADHFQYLACLGLISFAASAGTAMCERAGQKGRDWGAITAVIVLVILGVSTWRQARIYQNRETLWLDTVTKNPQCWLAHNNLGTVFLHDGKVSDAREQFEQALRIEPYHEETYINLGIVSMRQGKIGQAIAYYEQALRINPKSALVHNELGAALAQTGKTERAIDQFNLALWLDPTNFKAHFNLGVLLAQTGEIEEAITHYEQALRINPNSARIQYYLGDALAQVGRVPEAMEHLQQALRIDPDFTPAQNALARLQARE